MIWLSDDLVIWLFDNFIEYFVLYDYFTFSNHNTAFNLISENYSYFIVYFVL